MTDHTWTQDHVAAYIIGGLTREEIARVDAHSRACQECAAAVANVRHVDRGLQALFESVRPGLELEDEAIRFTRTIRPRRFVFANWLPRLAVAAGILVSLCLAGALAESLVRDGRLPTPGMVMNTPTRTRVETANNPDSMGDAIRRLTDGVGGVIAGNDRSGSPSGIGGGIQGGIGGGLGGSISGIGGVGGIGGKAGGAMPPGGITFPLRPPGSPAPPHPTLGGYAKPVVTTPAPPTAVASSFRPSEHRVVDPAEEHTKSDPPAEATPQSPGAKPKGDADPASRRVVIRSGEMEFEVASFDDAAASVTKLVSESPGAFIATVNSEKLASGKVRGTIVIRTPPEHVDRLVLEVRRVLAAASELKGLRIASQDITKQYTDLESRLRAARTMEERLIQVIKDGKGEIKQILEAEKELGVWRTKIEELEGEIRYYANLAALATLTISLAEKEARATPTVTENERVQAGVEVEDVDKAYQQTLQAVAEAKGRVAKSELKQLSAGQFNAALQFEAPPEAAGPLRDRLRQLGRVARLEIDRVQRSTAGSPPTDAQVKRGDTLFLVQIYNLANVAARESITLQLALPDVRVGYQSLREAVGKLTGRVLTANLNEQDAENVTGQLDAEIRRPDQGAIDTALDAAGEVVSREAIRAPEGDDTTDTKVLYRITLLSANRLPARETTTLTVEAADVEQVSTAFSKYVAEIHGRQVSAQSNKDQSGKLTVNAVYEVPLSAAGVVERFKAAGTVRAQQSVQNQQAPRGKFATARFEVTLVSRDQIVPADDGLWPQVRRGLSYSVAVLLTSVTWVIFGLCVVLPWGAAGLVGYRLFRRVSRGKSAAAATRARS